MYVKPIVLIVIGLGWLAVDVYWMFGNVILRETWLGTIAQFLDKLPPWASNPIFVCLWAIMLLGWTVPLIVGFHLLRSRASISAK
jgi:hypothetical protein